MEISSKIHFKKEHPKRRSYKPVLISEREARRRFERLRALLQASGGSLSRRMKCWRASSSQILFPAVSHHVQIFSGAFASAPLREHLKFEDDLCVDVLSDTLEGYSHKMSGAAIPRHSDAAMLRCSDTEILRYSDTATQRFSDTATQRYSDTATQRCRDAAIRRHRDTATQRYRHTAIQRCSNTETL